MQGRLVCLDHQERREVEVYLDRKEDKENLALQAVLESLAELVYQD